MLIETIVKVALVCVAAVSAAVMYFVEFVREKRGLRYRADPTCDSKGNTFGEKDNQLASQLAEEVRQCFEGNIGEELEGMTLEERKEKLEEIAERLLPVLGLEDVTILFTDSEELGARCQGTYSFGTNELRINEEYLRFSNQDVLLDSVDTVVHELTHAYQYQEIQKLLNQAAQWDDGEIEALYGEDKRVCDWLVNIQRGNYIKFEVDPEGYRKQPLEWYAFQMANTVLRNVLEGGEEE